jgi:hypothetical protein
MPHSHHHEHPPVLEDNSHAGQGAVVLDIGGTVGALVVSMPEAMLGREVEICPAGVRPAGHVPHVAVLSRPLVDGVDHSLVFPDLDEGRYDLNERGHSAVVLTVTVTGGRVTHAAWPIPVTAAAGSHRHVSVG